MKILLNQRFTYSSIIPYKDYCSLDEKPSLKRLFSDNLDNITDTDVFALLSAKNITHRKFTLPERRGKKRTKFFDSKDEVNESFVLKYVLKNHSFHTQKDNQIKRHFGKPFSDISLHIIERTIVQRDDKVTIKVYYGCRYRNLNDIYFKKNYHVMSITINLKTGNFITLEKSVGRNGTAQKFRCNGFMNLHNMVNVKNSIFDMNHLSNDSKLYTKYKEIFDDLEFTTKIQEILGINSTVNYSLNKGQFVYDIIGVFIKKKQIKVPNGDFTYWLTCFYPTEKYLKKNGRKLIAAILDMLGVKSKFLIKIVHENPDVELASLFKLCSYFGDDASKYMSNVNSDIFKLCSRKSNVPFSYNEANKNSVLYEKRHNNFILNNTEKENLIKIYNSYENNDYQDSFSFNNLRQFDDHFNMISKLREYDPNIQMNARNFKEFREEHRELSKMISAIRKGWVIEYEYSEHTIRNIEEKIESFFFIDDEEQQASSVILYPHILKREEEYIEEGSFMHHCVASYANHDHSIIVSIRNENQSNRVTCEFNIQTGECIQHRHFCNGKPPKEFEYAIEKLKERVKTLARYSKLNWLSKNKVPVKINGVEVQKELTRVNDVYPQAILPF